jgi:hypothetical protein
MAEFPASDGPLLWHYSTQAGTLGIVEQGALWATQIQFHNDGKELQLGFDIAARLLTDEFAHSLPLPAEVIAYMADYYRSTPATAFIFIGCFSENRDQLAQWRAGRPVNSYAIGFDRSALEEQAASLGWRLKQCEYNPTTQRQLMRDKLVRYFDAYLSGEFDALDPDPMSRAMRFSVPWVLETAAILKHDAFQEEREWRVVSPITAEGLMFRPGQHSVIPFVLFPLPAVDGRLWIPVTIVGPTSGFTELAKRALTELFHTRQVAWSHILESQLPFREWS